MAKFEKIENTFGQYQFYCPGCKTYHAIWTDARDGVIPWSFNGDVNKPTVTPSILVRFPHKDEMDICHSFIRDGFIEFLSDCTHSLVGKTIELSDLQDGKETTI